MSWLFLLQAGVSLNKLLLGSLHCNASGSSQTAQIFPHFSASTAQRFNDFACGSAALWILGASVRGFGASVRGYGVGVRVWGSRAPCPGGAQYD